MPSLQLEHISLAYGDRDVLKDVSLGLNTGDRIGLAGLNGSGKSTLMKIIAGLIHPDSGKRTMEKDIRVSYLPQSGVAFSEEDLLGEADRAFERLSEIEQKKKAVEEQLGALSEGDPKISELLKEQHTLEESLLEAGFYQREITIKKVLNGLGFTENDYETPCSAFSGGWQMRVALAKVLLQQPEIMLLDEPTNYLDIEAREWLLAYLQQYPGALLLVSHDRYVLDQLIAKVAELFMARLKIYSGNYSDYEKKRQQEREQQIEAYKKQERERKKTEAFIQKFRYNASKATLVQSRIKELEKKEKLEVPPAMKTVHFSFPPPPHSGKKVLRVEGLEKRYGDTRVLSNLSLSIDRGEKIAVLGKNGAGKSTLLRILGRKDHDYTGNVEFGAGVNVGYFAQEIDSVFDPKRTLIEEAEEQAPLDYIPKLRNLLGAFLFREDDLNKPIGVLSGGEKSRLALLTLLLHPVNLLVLDEPTNHLDIASKDVLLQGLKKYTGTCIFVSHDRYFIEELAERVIEITPLGMVDYPGDYSYYLRRIQTQEGETLEGSGKIQKNKRASQEELLEADKSDSQRFRDDQKARQRRRKGLLKQEQELLSRLEDLEREHTDLQHSISEPEVYVDGNKVRRLKEKLEQNEQEQSECASRWEEVEAELRSLSIKDNS